MKDVDKLTFNLIDYGLKTKLMKASGKYEVKLSAIILLDAFFGCSYEKS